MQFITLDGRLGAKGAEIKTTQNGGTEYLTFSLANTVFVGGKADTVWYDVTTYDPFIIEKKRKNENYLAKGTYVIVSGPIRIDIRPKSENIYINRYVTASSIDIPSITRKEDNPQAQAQAQAPVQAQAPIQEVSVFTGGTQSAQVQAQAPVYTAQVPTMPAAPSVFPTGEEDLPF